MQPANPSLDVSVPCPSCDAAVGFPGRVCPSCRAPVPRTVRDALEQRLEAADDDFREARADVRKAASVLLVLALLSLAVGLGKDLLELTLPFESPSEATNAHVQLWLQVATSAVFLGCFALVRRSPVVALATGLTVWLGIQVATAIEAPLTMLPMGFGGLVGGFLRLAFFAFLVRGLVAAVRGHVYLRKMGHGAGAKNRKAGQAPAPPST